MNFMQIDWKTEPPVREKILSCVAFLMLLVPCWKVLWNPVTAAVERAKSDLKIIDAQVITIRKMLELTSKEAVAGSGQSVAILGNDRAARILSRQTLDRNREVANAISSLSSRNIAGNIDLRDIAVGKEVVFPNFTAIPLDITLFAGYSSLERYLSAVENIERPLLVRQLSLTKSENRSGILEARLTILVYFAGMQ